MTRRVADRYVLGKQLGAGGTSRVHAALDERLGRQVAIKLLDAALVASADPAGRERFLKEGPTSASFSHRNAVMVFDAGEDEGDLYIVMELVDGPSLAEHLAKKSPLAVDEATSIARQVLAALEAAHKVGIVHRDVKPANVLLAADGDAKLADFGIAKRFDDLEDSVTTAGTVVGTPRYLAPEQAQGKKVTLAADIYATGILLFEMLTGKTPPPNAPVPNVRSLRPEVSEQLAATVARALAPKAADRFKSASAMAAALADSSAMATQVMAAETAETAVRSGDTQVMSSPVAAKPSRMRPAIAAAVVLLVIIVTAVLLSARGNDPPATALTTAATDAAVTDPTTGDTDSSTPDTVVDEIIPGFPRTDDIEVFWLLIEHDPDLVGEKGQELADRLREVLDQHGKKQRDAARDLREEMVKWVEDEELNADIADALDELLDRMGD